ncbi:signal peptidase [Campylobacter mucosalis]|uniref:signal peptidase I n=1 Tax=Campylobacter mucosalis TaxID=202 RepID=UPI0004D76144|nr:signal peptidase I [Campylobacter mucosalis]KEA45508.1 signal peptidase [Campylobacter mucosalis]QKF63323.1 leader peptidase (signal peptidase I) [Campylobacter mucosalis]
MKNFLKKAYEFSSSWTGTIIIVALVIFFIAQAFVIPSGSMKNTLLVGDHLFVKKFSYGIPTPRIPWLEIRVLPDFNGNDHLITGDAPKRDDIVVFRSKEDDKIHYVKRLFAVGKDEIIFSEKQTFLRPHEGDEFIKSNYKQEDLITINGRLFVREPYKHKGIHYDKNVNMFDIMVYALNSGKLAMKPVLVPEISPNQNYPFNAFYFKVPKDEFFMMGDNRDHSNDSRFWGSITYTNVVGKPWFIYFSWDKDYKIRWERIGRSIQSVQDSENLVDMAIKEDEIDGIY